MRLPIPLLFGTESGNAELCAESLETVLTDAGIAAVSTDMEHFECAQLLKEPIVLIITSTHGNGDPPANAAALLEYLQSDGPTLSSLQYAVCGLGDSAFQYFAQCGKDFDEALEKRGAQRLLNRIDCDDDYEETFARFQDAVLRVLQSEI